MSQLTLKRCGLENRKDIRDFRVNVLNFTQLQLSKRLRVSRSSIAMYEKGDRIPSEKFWTKLEKRLGYKKEDLKDL